MVTYQDMMMFAAVVVEIIGLVIAVMDYWITLTTKRNNRLSFQPKRLFLSH